MTGVVAEPIPALVLCIDGLAEESIDEHPDHMLGDDLAEIRRQVDRLEAQFLRRLDRFDRHHGAHAEGAASTVSWLRGVCGVTAATAAQRVRMSRAFAELPEAMASLAAGRSTFTNASMIARLAGDVGTDAVRSVEQTLVTAAEKLDPARMYFLSLATRQQLDADGALDADNRNHERRWFACDQTFGGMFVLRGELDAEGGAVLKTAIDALSSARGREDGRSGSQRRADALVDLAARQLQNGTLPEAHGQRPHLTVTASLEALQRQPMAGAPEIAGLGPVHPESARRLACDAVRTIAAVDAAPVGASDREAVRAISLSPPEPHPMAGAGAVLSIGRSTRTIPAPIRTALTLRDRGCRFPGCDRPPEWTDGHHIRHWADGGATALDNLVSLCRLHHRMVHERGWQISLDAEGEVEIIEPRSRAPAGRGAG